MFEVTAVPLRNVAKALEPHVAKLPWLAPLLEQGLSAERRASSAGEGPFVQLGYDEISHEEIERLLGYGGITSADASFGLAFDGPPLLVSQTPRTLVYSLRGLRDHLQEAVPSTVAACEEAGGMDNFAAARGEAMTAAEYLVGGLLECIKYCEEGSQALVVRW